MSNRFNSYITVEFKKLLTLVKIFVLISKRSFYEYIQIVSGPLTKWKAIMFIKSNTEIGFCLFISLLCLQTVYYVKCDLRNLQTCQGYYLQKSIHEKCDSVGQA